MNHPNDMPADTELREQLAAIEHERWSHWQKWMQGEMGVNTLRQTWDDEGNLIIPAVLVKAWQRQIDTPYQELSESEKDSDREQVDRYWPLIKARDAAIRIDELERCMEQTEMERHQNGYAVPYRFINDRIAELRRESDLGRPKGGELSTPTDQKEKAE